MALLKGIIMQSISGFYYVEAADGVYYECRARGQFRKSGITPLVGDRVEIDTDEKKGTVVNVLTRSNSLQRPPVANIDILFIVSSVERPKPNLFVLDKLSAFAVYNNIEPVIVFSKSDLGDVTPYRKIYEKTGFKVLCCSAEKNEGLDEISALISGKTCAFTGNSGVGKSSILNVLCPGLRLETNEISDKLGRGKHTTRSVHLYHVGDGFIADTPGFSSIDFENGGDKIFKEDLPLCFPEFAPFTDSCKFVTSCSHITDRGCAVREAVTSGVISPERYDSYCKMYEEVRNFKKWE